VAKKVKETVEIRFRPHEPTLLRLRFKYNPEYITLGQRVVINELKLVGRVKEIYY
jgi:GTPase